MGYYMNHLKLVGLVVALAFTATAAAESPKWTFIEGNYWRGDSSEGDGIDENSSYGIFGSLGFADIGHVQAGYNDGEIEGTSGNPDEDVTNWFIRAGAHPELNDTTDLIADFFYREVEFDDSNIDCDAYGARTGLRSHAINDKAELMTAATWTDLDCDSPLDEGTDFTFEAGGQYFWTPNVSTGLVFTVNDVLTDGDSVRFFIRGSFEDPFQ